MYYIAIILVSIATITMGMAWLMQVLNERIIAQANAQAIVINANAQANVLLLTASIPVIAVTLIGLAIVLIILNWTKNKPQIIEHRIVYENLPRREVWHQLEAMKSNGLITINQSLTKIEK